MNSTLKTKEEITQSNSISYSLVDLNNSILYKVLKEKCKDIDQEVVLLVENGIKYAIQRTKPIIKYMGEYTLHDSDHLFRVLEIMELLLTEQQIRRLNTPELMLLILSAFFHDIGMAPSESEVTNWKTAWDQTSPVFEDKLKQESFFLFKRFLDVRPESLEQINLLVKLGKSSEAETLKGYLISEYIRQTHADRARQIIDKEEILGDNNNRRIKFRDVDLTVQFANLCHSHNEDPLKLMSYDKNFFCGKNIVICMPLLGIILRLADILDFDAKRTPDALFSHLHIRNPISLKEWQKHRSINAWNITPNIAQFSASCNHPVIEASIREFCDIIDNELSACNIIATSINEFHKSKDRDLYIKLPFEVNRDEIKAERTIYDNPIYTYRETKFSLSKNQVIDLLMGTKLYGNPEVALRELLQNSIDACLLRKAQELSWGNSYAPIIDINYYQEDEQWVLQVEDNGTGMNQYIIDNYYTQVGSSFYKSTDFNKVKLDSNADFSPTSRFGIGILSIFMISDSYTVDTLYVTGPQSSDKPINMTVEGQDSVFWFKTGERTKPGTSTKIFLRKSTNPWETMRPEDFIKSVEGIIANPPFKININTSTIVKTRTENSFKEIKADSLIDHTWNQVDNIHYIDIELNSKGEGIVGSCKVAILLKNDKPTRQIESHSIKDVYIDGILYPINREMEIDGNKIIERSTSINVDTKGNVVTQQNTKWLASSKNKVSLHGIEIAFNFFPTPWESRKNLPKLDWPFPMLLVVDICNPKDLDINSARTEILKSDKWKDFEDTLAFEILNAIKKNVSSVYWDDLLSNILSESSNSAIIKALEKIEYEYV